MFEGGLDGFALRIKDGFLWCDDDFGFHAREKKSLWKNAAGSEPKKIPERNLPARRV
jgi:hypothetical protein